MREEEESEEMRWRLSRGEGGVAAALLLTGHCDVSVTGISVA